MPECGRADDDRGNDDGRDDDDEGDDKEPMPLLWLWNKERKTWPTPVPGLNPQK